jgi:hypothetical protein
MLQRIRCFFLIINFIYISVFVLAIFFATVCMYAVDMIFYYFVTFSVLSY